MHVGEPRSSWGAAYVHPNEAEKRWQRQVFIKHAAAAAAAAAVQLVRYVCDYAIMPTNRTRPRFVRIVVFNVCAHESLYIDCAYICVCVCVCVCVYTHSLSCQESHMMKCYVYYWTTALWVGIPLLQNLRGQTNAIGANKVLRHSEA